MRAKLKVTAIEQFETSENLKLEAVYKEAGYPEDGTDEDNTFARWTPSASLTMTITNPNLLKTFKVGQKFYVDFTEVEAGWNPLVTTS